MIQGNTVPLNNDLEKREVSLPNHESESTRRDMDIISQFRANMNQLEDLQGHFRFVLNEVANIVKKRT